jgi:hypothetical protein
MSLCIRRFLINFPWSARKILPFVQAGLLTFPIRQQPSHSTSASGSNSGMSADDLAPRAGITAAGPSPNRTGFPFHPRVRNLNVLTLPERECTCQDICTSCCVPTIIGNFMWCVLRRDQRRKFAGWMLYAAGCVLPVMMRLYFLPALSKGPRLIISPFVNLPSGRGVRS